MPAAMPLMVRSAPRRNSLRLYVRPSPSLRRPVRRRALAGALGTGQCAAASCRAVGSVVGVVAASQRAVGVRVVEEGLGGQLGSLVVGISGGASGSGRAAAPGSSALRRVVRWKDSAIVSCRFDDSAVAVVAA